MLNAVMSVLDGFENTKRVVEEKLCAKLVFEGIEIDISRRLIYSGMQSADSTRRFCGAKRTRCGASGLN